MDIRPRHIEAHPAWDGVAQVVFSMDFMAVPFSPGVIAGKHSG